MEKEPMFKFEEVKITHSIFEYEKKFSSKKDRTFKITLTHNINNENAHNKITNIKFPLPIKTNYQYLMNEIENSGNYDDISTNDNILNAKFSKNNATITTKFDIFTSSRYTHFQTINYDKDEKFTPQISKFINLNIDNDIKQKANFITQNLKNDLDKARTIYNWICENFEWNESKLIFQKTKNLLNKQKVNSLDASMLFADLCNSLNIPARVFIGIKIGESAFAKSMGCDKNGDISKSHHARVEFYLKGYGWVPCDIADPIKIRKYENYTKNDSMYKFIRDYLFGTWEMNWMEIALILNPSQTLIYPKTNTQNINKLYYKYIVEEFSNK